MADLTLTASQLRIMESIEARLIPMISDATITKGMPVYRKTNGKAGIARANDTSTSKLVGIATTDATAGNAFEALHYGRLAGYDLSGVDPGETVFLSSAAAGTLADAAATGTGNTVVPVGTVHCMTDRSLTKFLFVDIRQSVADAVELT